MPPCRITTARCVIGKEGRGAYLHVERQQPGVLVVRKGMVCASV